MLALQKLKKVINLYLTFFNKRKQSGEKHVTNYKHLYKLLESILLTIIFAKE